jgi:L-alanine-DL-glutamate epimerase-like enolase superfamily enzyme
VSDKVGIVEFLEQPLPPEQFKTMLEMSRYYSTPIALDESVATLNQLEACYQQGWRGIFVIKPSIAGSPKRLRQFCKAHDIDTVFSSVFESAIARQAALQLATELSHRNRAVGFGINHWFNDNDETWLEQSMEGALTYLKQRANEDWLIGHDSHQFSQLSEQLFLDLTQQKNRKAPLKIYRGRARASKISRKLHRRLCCRMPRFSV